MLVACSTLLLAALVLFLNTPAGRTWTPMLSFLGFGTRQQQQPAPVAETTARDDNKKEDPRSEDKRSTSSEDVEDRRSRSPPSGDSTPRATPADTKPASGAAPVPTFSLNSNHESDSEEEEEDLPPPSFPAMNSAQRASAAPSHPRGPPTLKPLPVQATRPSQLMPPPPRPIPNRTIPANGSLRPSNGPLPNRGPPGAGLKPPTGGLLVPQSIASKTPNPRQKVLLKPGRSPLDWATLLKSGSNLSGVDRLHRVTPSQLKFANGRKGRPCWSSYQGKVYNIGTYLEYHPGGEGELRRAAGKDGEKLFLDVHPWVNWENMLGECLVGITVGENDMAANASSLEDMD
ncbi:hypothetical protein K402DRAFT_397440 [Aulographum hederae CBS 113979]|uniref:Cytochrome b5 heme-binding domain-containing protein n=1 Tax=Aulographum hederae CBS 113979 TaxID=1176131 RepID=A0A6G1GP48_9PEZI|nr:hypothetical protein K402DRAFT_397440 [Aulographum hederae CBS 113979]